MPEVLAQEVRLLRSGSALCRYRSLPHPGLGRPRIRVREVRPPAIARYGTQPDRLESGCQSPCDDPAPSNFAHRLAIKSL